MSEEIPSRMAEAGKSLERQSEYRFGEPGTHAAPGPIGRAVRLILGLLLLWVVYRLLFRSDVTDLLHPSFWFGIIIALWVGPAVISIGWGREWTNRQIRLLAVFLGIALAALSYLMDGNPAGRLVWWYVLLFQVYVFGHLGICFVLASVLATPGCEMRAIPHLYGLLTGRDRDEHPCPSFIGNLDRWEAGRQKG